MTDLPEPMTPPDCDLRGYEFMPVFGHRLFGSAFYARATDAEFRAAMRLWWAAWQQCPAGSLPNDDANLALLADYGRDVKGFRKVREAALHGFVECSDGRLYHPLLCQEARGAYDRRRKERERKARLRARDTAEQTPPSGGDIHPPSSVESAACPAGHPVEREGTGQDRTGQDSNTSSLRSEGGPSPAERPPPDAKAILWTEGLSRLRRITGKPDGAARGLLGRLCREARDDCALVSSLLHQAEADRVGDPIPWLTKAIQIRTGAGGGSSRPSRIGWLIDEMTIGGSA